MKEKFKWLIIFLVMLAVILRLYYFVYPLGKSAEITVDEAVYGLQAIKISNGDRPVFYPAQDYTGSFSAYLSSLLFFLVGISPFTLKVIPFIFSIGTVVLIYLLAKRVFGNSVAAFTLFICALGTPFWNNWSSRAGSGYVEATFFGVLILLLTIRVTEDSLPTKTQTIYFLLVGLFSGLGFWIQPTIIYFVFPVMVYLFVFLRKRFLIFLVFFALGFLVGAGPVIYYNSLLKPSATSSALFKKPWGIRTSLIKLVVEGMPVLLGGRTANSRVDFNPLTSNFVYLLFISSLAYFARVISYGKKFIRPEGLIFLTLISTVGIFIVATPFNQFSIEPRYVFSLYSVIPIVLGVFLSKISQISRYLVIFVLLVYSFNFVSGIVQAGPLSFLDSYKFKSLVYFLHQHKIEYAVATASLGHRVAFFSNGEIKTGVRGGGITEARFEKDNQEVSRIRDNDPRLVAYVGLKGDSEIKAFREEAKSQMGDYFFESEVEQNFVIYYSK